MKKLLYILLGCAVCSFLFMSCSEETVNPYADDLVEGLVMKAIDSQTEYMPVPSQGVLVFDTDQTLSASSDKDWCTTSVSGNTVTLTLAANEGKLTRYAQITVKSASAVSVVSIFQYGEILSGLGDLNGVTSPVEGDVITIPIKVNVDIVFDIPEPWVHIERTENALVITVDKNDEPRTRSCVVNYTAGSQSGSFEVTQYPELKQNDNWVLSLDDASYKYPDFRANASVSADAGDMYVLMMVPTSSVSGSVQDYIFSDLAVAARRDILEKVDQEGGNFADYLEKGSGSSLITPVSLGDNYLVAIGFGENGFVTGQYQYKEVTVDDVRPTYYKWVGKWVLTGKNIKGADYTETFELSVDETDVDESGNLKEEYLVVHGLCSKNQAGAEVTPEMNVDGMYVMYDKATEALTFYGQNGEATFTHSSRGANCRLQLISMYVKAGATSYTNVTGGKFLSVKMNSDLKTTVVTALERSAGLPYRAFRMRLLNSGGSAYTIGGDDATIAINESLTISRP